MEGGVEQEFVPLVMVREHLTKLSYQCQVQTQMSWVCMACSFADELLRNLWRWLGSPDSALQSPALRQAVRGLMKKMLAQLVATLKKLGARVIAADASSVTLATGKRNLTAAVGCVSLHLYMSPFSAHSSQALCDCTGCITVTSMASSRLQQVDSTMADQLAVTRLIEGERDFG